MTSHIAATGERTVPGLAREEYWFARHEAAYAWIAQRLATPVEEERAHRIVVDAGAGEGYGTSMLAPAIALEYDGAVCRHLHSTYPGVAVAQANLAALPLRTGHVDVIVCLQVVEHLWDLPTFLRDCHRALAPGGDLIVTTPQRLTFSPGLGRGEKPMNPFHVEEFDAEQLAGLLEEAGFGDIALRGLHHGDRIVEWERVHGSIVRAQVDAAVGDDWPAHLADFVATINVDDFHIDAMPRPVADSGLAQAQDLLAIATVRG